MHFFKNDEFAFDSYSPIEKFGEGIISYSHIKSISFPSATKVKEIPTSAFQGCQHLSSIETPLSVERIERSAFYETILESIPFHPDSRLQCIGVQPFSHCTRLTLIEIPSSVQVFSNYAFHDSSCQTITFAPNSQLETIGVECSRDW